MPRTARVVAEGLPHHVTQRGNRRTDIFLDDDDRVKYLDFLERYGKKHGMEILAYCLMSNHVHLVVVPKQAASLAHALAAAHTRYAQFFNWKYHQSGHLWQGRFFSCVLDEQHTLAAVRYVERNPLRAGLVGRPWDYRWSSARAHISEMKGSVLAERWPPDELRAQWREFLVETDNGQKAAEIRLHTRRGCPLGSDDFVRKLERIFGREMVIRSWGRPRKKL